MSCPYCQPDEAGNLKWMRDEPDCSAYLEEYNDEWGIVTSVTNRCNGHDCTTDMYVKVNNCPMCGREL